MIRLIPIAALVALSACATQEERCISEAEKDLNVVNLLIAEAEANIERGYALETRETPSVGFRFCSARDSRAVLCTSTRTRTRTEPVAINLDEERAKLASLEEKRRELVLRTERDVAACEAQYAGQDADRT